MKYDANGNLTEDGGAIYTWDARDRLVAVTSRATGTKTAIQYDGLDRWAVITDAGKEVRYRWCGQELCAALDTAGKAKAHYFGDRGMYVLLANGQAQRVAFVTDHLGSVKQYHDTAGKWLLSLDHEAYGGISRADLSPAGISLLNSGVVVPGWAGLYMHWPTGTYLAAYRPYSSQLKRWLRRDPIEERGGLNLYAYVGGHPVKYRDPSGLCPMCLPLIPAAMEALLGAGIVYAGYQGLSKTWDLILNQNNSNPLTGEPGSEQTCGNKKGNKKQTRRYGADGYPETDTDWDHSHGGLGSPHAHDWGRPSDGGPPTHGDRGEGRPPVPGDPGIPK